MLSYSNFSFIAANHPRENDEAYKEAASGLHVSQVS